MGGRGLLMTLLGGIALLLWGVRMVRTGTAYALGASLRSLIGSACANRLTAFATGLCVTALLQGGTATALLFASFTSRNLIGLPLTPAARGHSS